MSVQELLKTLVDEIATLSRTETVVGEPLHLGEHTVIPISRVSVGFGGGSGEGEGGDGGKTSGKGEGGGGGGGIKVEPAAFIVEHRGELSVLAAPTKKGALSEMFEKMPDLFSKIAAATGGRGGKGGKTGAKGNADEPATPEGEGG